MSFQGLGTNCNTLYNFLIPVIRLSTDVTQQFHVYLKEDGLDLWLETLHNSPVLTPDLLELFTAMPALLGMSQMSVTGKRMLGMS